MVQLLHYLKRGILMKKQKFFSLVVILLLLTTIIQPQTFAEPKAPNVLLDQNIKLHVLSVSAGPIQARKTNERFFGPI